MILLITFITVMGLLLGLYNGFIYAMALPGKREPHYNKLVHRTGWLIRVAAWITAMTLGYIHRIALNDLIWLSLYSLLWFYPVFNVLYSLINDEEWFYSGSSTRHTGSWFDKRFGKYRIPLYIWTLLMVIGWYPLDLLYFVSNTLIPSFRERPVEWIVTLGLIVGSIILVRKFHFKRKAE